jgi:hypothetical protein
MSSEACRTPAKAPTAGMTLLLVLPNGEPYARWDHQGDERWINDLEQGMTFEDVLDDLDNRVEELFHGR